MWKELQSYLYVALKKLDIKLIFCDFNLKRAKNGLWNSILLDFGKLMWTTHWREIKQKAWIFLLRNSNVPPSKSPHAFA